MGVSVAGECRTEPKNSLQMDKASEQGRGIFMYYTARYWSPVGPLLLAGREDGLIGMWLEGQKYFGAGLPELLPA